MTRTKSALSRKGPVLIALAFGIALLCILFVVILSRTTSSASTTNVPPAFTATDASQEIVASDVLLTNKPSPAMPTDRQTYTDPLVSWDGVAIWPTSADVVMVRKPGDTKLTRIRLAGLEVPIKSTREVEGQEPWGTRAHQFVVIQVTQQRVRVEIDPISPLVNRYSPIGYIWIGDKLLNEEMLAGGYAFLRADASRLRYADRLQQALEDAQNKQLGVWDPLHPFPMTTPDATHAGITP